MKKKERLFVIVSDMVPVENSYGPVVMKLDPDTDKPFNRKGAHAKAKRMNQKWIDMGSYMRATVLPSEDI